MFRHNNYNNNPSCYNSSHDQHYISSCIAVQSQLVQGQHTGNIKCIMRYVTWYTPCHPHSHTPFPWSHNPLGIPLVTPPGTPPWSHPFWPHPLATHTPLGTHTPWAHTHSGTQKWSNAGGMQSTGMLSRLVLYLLCAIDSFVNNQQHKNDIPDNTHLVYHNTVIS